MWEGKITQELIELHREYREKHDDMGADEYEEIFYDGMSYEEYIGYIRLCLEKNLEIPDVVK